MAVRLIDNPPNPYDSAHVEWLEPAPPAKVQVYEETAATILTENDSPDIPFRWSINPYRGCQHACAYCYARPYHEYLDWGAGTDFDTKIVVKTNAAEELRKAFSKKKWTHESVTFSGVTDCYQPLEAVYKLTQACLQICLEFANPVGIVTKSYLVMRDAGLLAELNRAAGATVYQSIPFSDDDLARKIEPYAPPPTRRFDAMRRLSAAGVPVGVMVAPIIPGLNDDQIPDVLRRAADAGARTAAYVPLRLPGSVRQVFTSRLREALPLRAQRVINRIREMRGGRMNDPRFGDRFRGHGEYWRNIEELFRVAAERHGLNRPARPSVEQSDARLIQISTPSSEELPPPPPPKPHTQLLLDFG